MEQEALRKQILEELQLQFDTKLREAKRQKSQAEEELESSAERWRSERRRLNSEIDRLETALSEAREPSRRKTAPESKQPVTDQAEIARIKAAAEEKLQAAQEAWTVERGQLLDKASRLEHAVADLIERSGNPMRSTQPIKEQFEAKLDEASRMRREAEQQFLRAKAEWDEEKKKLTGEIMKLRRYAPTTKAIEAKERLERSQGRKESPEEVRIRELEVRLSEANADIQKFHQQASTAREEVLKQFQPRLEDAYREKVKAEEKLVQASMEWEAERQRLQEEMQQLQQVATHAASRTDIDSGRESALQIDLRDAVRARTAAEEMLDRQTSAWSAERSRLKAELEQLEQNAAETLKTSFAASRAQSANDAQTIATLEERLRQHSNREEQLAAAATLWEKEKLQLLDALARAEARPAQPSASDELQRLEARLEQALRAKDTAQSELEQQRQQWLDERQTLAAQVERLERKLSQTAQAATDERAAESAALSGRITSLERQVRQFETEKAELEEARAKSVAATRQETATQLAQAARERETANERLQGEQRRWESERSDLQGEIQQLQRTLAKTRETVSTEVVDQLRLQYDAKIQEMIDQKTQLSRELEAATATLRQERSRFTQEAAQTKAAAASSRSGAVGGALDAEVTRVERMIQDITALIDDPATELSTVIRKNVEKAELDAYLKGILFSLGRGKSMV